MGMFFFWLEKNYLMSREKNVILTFMDVIVFWIFYGRVMRCTSSGVKDIKQGFFTFFMCESFSFVVLEEIFLEEIFVNVIISVKY